MDAVQLCSILEALGDGRRQPSEGRDALLADCSARLVNFTLTPAQRTVHTFSDEQECDMLDDKTEKKALLIVAQLDQKGKQ
eukprot:5026882-Prymnesium_polylepis.1